MSEAPLVDLCSSTGEEVVTIDSSKQLEENVMIGAQQPAFYQCYTPQPGGASYMVPATNLSLSLDQNYRFHVMHSARKHSNEAAVGGVPGPGAQVRVCVSTYM